MYCKHVTAVGVSCTDCQALSTPHDLLIKTFGIVGTRRERHNACHTTAYWWRVVGIHCWEESACPSAGARRCGSVEGHRKVWLLSLTSPPPLLGPAPAP